MKILMVSNNYKPYSGGLVSAIDVYMNSLEKLGHEVKLVTLDFLGDNLENKEDLTSNIIRVYCPIRFKYRNNHMAVPIGQKKTINNIIKNFKPDIIHTHHPFLLGKTALKLAKKNNIKIVFTYHTNYEQYAHYVPILPKKFVVFMIKKLVKKFCSKVDYMIFPSESVKNIFFDKYGLENINYSVIPSGISEIFANRGYEFKKINNPKFKLLTVSRFTKEKNIEFLLEVFSKLDQTKFELNLVGYGDHLGCLQDLAYKKLNIPGKNLKFIISPEKNVLREHYSNSNLFLFASKTETQGLVLAESMACGTPVIALDASGSRDIVCDGINGYTINSVDQMVEKINSLENNKELLAKISYGAWQTSKNYFPENSITNLVKVYNLFS